MADEDAEYYAATMEELQRQVLALCSYNRSLGYSRIAEKLGATYGDVHAAGDFLKSANLAVIETTRLGNKYSGSGIFLNARGEAVRQALVRLGL